MPRRYYSNVAQPVYLVGTLDGSSSTNSIGVSATAGGSVASTPSGWPSSTPYFACIDPGMATEEVVQVTAVAGGYLTITRGTALGTLAYGSTTKAHQSGAIITHVITAADADEGNSHINASQAVHGLAVGSSVVGTTDTQTLNNKTLGSGVIGSGVTINASTPLSAGGLIVGTTATQTLTNKTLTSPALTGATNDGAAIATTTGTQTLTNKTLTSPVVTGTIDAAAATFSGALTAKAAFQAGVKTCSVTTANTAREIAVVFSQAFSVVPVVTVSPGTTSTAVTACTVGAVSATGFNIHFNRSDTLNTDVNWIAHLPTQAAS